MKDKKTQLKTVSLALGATLATTLAASNIASAATPAGANPFAMSDLGSGYMQLADAHKGKEGKCGEGKCGGDKKDKKEGKCGEGKCGEGKCGADKKGKKEGKCGEGKCGGKK